MFRMLRFLIFVLGVFLGLPANAQTVTVPTPPSIVTNVENKLGSGTLLTADKGHFALQFSPCVAVAVAQQQHTSIGQYTLTGLKTYAAGMQLLASFWPKDGAYLAHVALQIMAGYGSPNNTSNSPTSGVLGLSLQGGGLGLFPTIGLGLGIPVLPASGANISMQPMLLVTASFLQMWALLEG